MNRNTGGAAICLNGQERRIRAECGAYDDAGYQWLPIAASSIFSMQGMQNDAELAEILITMQLNSAELAGTDIQEQGRVVLGTGKDEEKKHIFYTASTAVQAFCNSSAKQLAFSDDCCGLRMIPEVCRFHVFLVKAHR